MRKYEMMNKLADDKLMAVIRTDTAEQAVKAGKACFAGGINFLEVTFTVDDPGAAIKTLSADLPGAIVGAGTVLDAETAALAASWGAGFIVSPYFSSDIAKVCNRHGIPYFPGIMTVKEMMEALESGQEMVKIFPSNVLGTEFLKSVKSAVPQCMFMPTGGVNLSNAADWLNAGASVLGVGGSLLKGVKTGDYKSVEKYAADLRSVVDRHK